MGGCQNYDPFWGTLNSRCRIIIGTQKRDHNFDNHPYVFQGYHPPKGTQFRELPAWPIVCGCWRSSVRSIEEP